MSNSESEQYGLLDQLAEEFAQRFRRGERPALKEYTDRYPELDDQIRDLFPALVKVEQVEGVRQGEEEVQPANSRAANPPPKQIGDYRILREIGRGGMGVVYEAEQISLGRRVALKVLSRHAYGDGMTQERFRREARAAARLHHTNIVPVFEVGQDDDVRFYAMQFIQGQGLDLVITELRRLRARIRSESNIVMASGGKSLGPGGTLSRQSFEEPTLGDEVLVSAVLQSILTGAFDSGGQAQELKGVSPSVLVRALVGGLVAPIGMGSVSRAAGSDLALALTETGSASAGDRPGPNPALPAARALSRSASPSSSSAILPGGTQLSSVEPGRRAFFRSLAQIGRQVAGGLAYAHARGIVHRDIKPANLLLDTEGVVWIADLGLAKGEDEGLTQSGDILGTLHYMAPERFRGEGDARADVYALGLTLYELLTLRPGFESSDRLKLIEKIKTDEPQKPRAVDARIPRDLETIVLKAIEKDPKARYQSAEAMGEDLRRFLADEPIVARPVLFWERALKWSWRRPALAAMLVLVHLLLTGLLGLGVWSYVRISQALETAQDQSRNADMEQKVAVAAASREATARGKADQANASLRATQEELRRTVYATRSNLALGAWEANDIGRLRFLLELMQPRQDESDLRGWEWHYLDRFAHEERLTFRDHDREVSQVAFSPDGRTVASVQWGGRVELWDPATGDVRFTLRPPQPPATSPLQSGVSGLAFSPDGERVAGPGPDATLGIWNTRTGAPIHHFKVSSVGTPSIAFSPDGRTIATGSASRSIGIWDVADGRPVRVIENVHDRGAVERIVFSPDGRRLASTGDGTIKLWDLETGKLHAALSTPAVKVFGLAFSPDDRTLVTGGSDQVVRIWDTATGHERGQFWGHASTIRALALSPDGRRLASAGSDTVVRLWDMDSGRQLRTFKGHTDRISHVAFSPDGNTLASSSFDWTVKLWDASRPSQPLVLKSQSLTNLEAEAWCVTFSPDGRQIVSGHEDHAVRVWDTATGRLRLTLSGHDAVVYSVALSPSGQTIASTGVDRTVRLWDATTGRLRSRLAQHTGQVDSARFSPDGRRLVSSSSDDTLKVWDPETSECVLSIPNAIGSTERAQYRPDGRTIAANAGDGHVTLWDAETGRLVSTVGNHPSVVRDFTFSPDGKTVAICYKDNLVVLWDTATGELQRTLKGHTARVNSVAFSPDGRRLVSAGHDQTIRLWDLASGQDLLTLKGHSGWIRAVAFSGDGNKIASASSDGSVMVWDGSPRAVSSAENPGRARP